MSLNYLLDGYNIIHRDERFTLNSFDDARLALIRFLEIHHPQGSFRNTVMVVFDGHPQAGDDNFLFNRTVKVVFSQTESADDYIKRFVERAVNPQSIVVVTDDKEIKFAVRACGATVLSVEDFLDKAKSKTQSKESRQKSTGSKGKTPSKVISKSLEQNITRELEDYWLKKPREK